MVTLDREGGRRAGGTSKGGGLAAQLYRQFGRPSGWLGHVAGWVMATRPSNRERNRWAVSLLNLEPEDRVLEIGHGPGLALAQVSAAVSRGTAVGIDHSPVMHRWARGHNAAAVRQGRVALYEGGLELLPTLPGAFDKVYSVNVAMFWPDRPAGFRAIRSVLKPNGVCLTVHQPRHVRARPEDVDRYAEAIVADMQSAGFINLRTERLPLNPMPAVAVLGGA